MNSSFNEIISKLSEDQTYQNMFKDAFDNGEISEVGKHIDLLNKKGIYKELCEKQLIKKV